MPSKRFAWAEIVSTMDMSTIPSSTSTVAKDSTGGWLLDGNFFFKIMENIRLQPSSKKKKHQFKFIIVAHT
jgi:hypothetical protein